MGIVHASQEQFDALMASIEKDRQWSADQMPDEKSALMVMHKAFERLRELGWREAIYCPKDGSEFDVIEPGSTGIHRCIYEGEWPSGRWWIVEDGDMSPSRPILFKARSATASSSTDSGDASK